MDSAYEKQHRKNLINYILILTKKYFKLYRIVLSTTTYSLNLKNKTEGINNITTFFYSSTSYLENTP